MTQNYLAAESPFDYGDQEEERSSLHQSSDDLSFVSFELPLYLKCVDKQKCYLCSFPLLPEGSSKSISKLSLDSTGMKDFYSPFDAADPNPSNNKEDNSSVNIRPSEVMRLSSAVPESLFTGLNMEHGPGYSSCHAFRKLPSNFNNTIRHPAIEREVTVLFLFQLGNRCFPFCVELDSRKATFSVLIDGKTHYLLRASVFWEPPSSDESLTVTALIKDQVYVLHLPGFNMEQKIEMNIGRSKYHILFGLLESSFDVADVPSDSVFFYFDKKDIPMRVSSWREIALPQICQPAVFSRNLWFNTDKIELMKRSSNYWPFMCDEKVEVKIGTVGTLTSFETGRRVSLGNGLFRIFITETNELIVLQKYLRVSLKLSLN